MCTSKDMATPKILPLCYKVAEHENVVWVCDGAANARMCCTTAVAAGSKPHLEIAEKAKKNMVINECGNRCASKVLANVGKSIHYEIDISKYLQKVPTLDIYQADIKK